MSSFSIILADGVGYMTNILYHVDMSNFHKVFEQQDFKVVCSAHQACIYLI